MSSSETSANEERVSEEEVSSDEDESLSSTEIKLADDEFRQMSFEDLLKLKRRLGSKVYNEAVFGKESKKIPAPVKSKTKRGATENMHQEDSDSDGPPEELSAKRKVSALGTDKKRQQMDLSRFKDPRFDCKQGYFSGRKFREQYGFINDLRNDELKELKKQLTEAIDPDEVERLKYAMRRVQNQILEFQKQKVQDEKRKEEKLQIRKTINEGKRPYFEKNSTKKARELVEKYDKLTKEGKIGKHLDKRKRKITAKDRKRLDFST